jgi:hypothetical protein
MVGVTYRKGSFNAYPSVTALDDGTFQGYVLVSRVPNGEVLRERHHIPEPYDTFEEALEAASRLAKRLLNEHSTS